jgi:hypothetical protein
VKNYSPQFVTFSFQGINIIGFAKGTFIEAERAEDGFKKKVGSQGDVVRVQSMDRSGKVTITLQAQSPSNDLLLAIAQLDEATGAAVGTLQAKDLNTTGTLGGDPLIHAKEAWIMKVPKIDRSDDSSNCVWVFECADLDLAPTGAIF